MPFDISRETKDVIQANEKLTVQGSPFEMLALGLMLGPSLRQLGFFNDDDTVPDMEITLRALNDCAEAAGKDTFGAFLHRLALLTNQAGVIIDRYIPCTCNCANIENEDCPCVCHKRNKAKDFPELFPKR